MDFPVLETSRLYLRKITTDDANDIFEYLSNDKVTRYLGKKSLINIDEVYDLINELDTRYDECRGIRWGVIHKENRKLIGTIGYDAMQIKNKRADIGYDINSNYWRQGFATEAINEVIKFGFDLKNAQSYLYTIFTCKIIFYHNTLFNIYDSHTYFKITRHLLF